MSSDLRAIPAAGPIDDWMRRQKDGPARCPYCGVSFSWSSREAELVGADINGIRIEVEHANCPACRRLIIQLVKVGDPEFGVSTNERGRMMVYPRSTGRPPCPPEVPKEVCSDYTEACLVLRDSPKASAALSRRILQHILREEAHIQAADLAREIDAVMASGALSAQLAASLDLVRTVGNFAAHPTKSTATNAIIEVELGEAEWNLAVIEELMDFYYVKPAAAAKQKAAINAKLAAAGKPLIP